MRTLLFLLLAAPGFAARQIAPPAKTAPQRSVVLPVAASGGFALPGGMAAETRSLKAQPGKDAPVAAPELARSAAASAAAGTVDRSDPASVRVDVRANAIAGEIGIPSFIRRGEDGQPVAFRTVQTAYGIPVPLIQGAAGVKQGASYKKPDLVVFKREELFAEPVHGVVFGVPNMATLMGPQLYSAYSARRQKSEILAADRLQAALFAVMPDLTAEQKKAIEDSAAKHVGDVGLTCVNQNCRMLAAAGFKIGWRPMWSYYFPNGVLKAMLKYGMTYKGEPVRVVFPYMNPENLETYWQTVRRSVFSAPARQKERKERAKAIAEGRAAPVPEPSVMLPAPKALPAVALSKLFRVKANTTSRWAAAVRPYGGTHLYFQVQAVDQDQARAATYRHFGTQYLEPFPDTKESPLSASSRLKKHILFNRFMVWLINLNMRARQRFFAARTLTQQEYSTDELYKMMLDFPARYNLVVRDSGVSVAPLEGIGGSWPRLKKLLDWVLAKHVLMSAYSKEVRFAGEVWKDEDGVIRVSGNSGTYKPTRAQIDAAVHYLRELFPGVPIEPVHMP